MLQNNTNRNPYHTTTPTAEHLANSRQFIDGHQLTVLQISAENRQKLSSLQYNILMNTPELDKQTLTTKLYHCTPNDQNCLFRILQQKRKSKIIFRALCPNPYIQKLRIIYFLLLTETYHPLHTIAIQNQTINTNSLYTIHDYPNSTNIHYDPHIQQNNQKNIQQTVRIDNNQYKIALDVLRVKFYQQQSISIIKRKYLAQFFQFLQYDYQMLKKNQNSGNVDSKKHRNNTDNVNNTHIQQNIVINLLNKYPILDQIFIDMLILFISQTSTIQGMVNIDDNYNIKLFLQTILGLPIQFISDWQFIFTGINITIGIDIFSIDYNVHGYFTEIVDSLNSIQYKNGLDVSNVDGFDQDIVFTKLDLSYIHDLKDFVSNCGDSRVDSQGLSGEGSSGYGQQGYFSRIKSINDEISKKQVKVTAIKRVQSISYYHPINIIKYNQQHIKTNIVPNMKKTQINKPTQLIQISQIKNKIIGKNQYGGFKKIISTQTNCSNNYQEIESKRINFFVDNSKINTNTNANNINVSTNSNNNNNINLNNHNNMNSNNNNGNNNSINSNNNNMNSNNTNSINNSKTNSNSNNSNSNSKTVANNNNISITNLNQYSTKIISSNLSNPSISSLSSGITNILSGVKILTSNPTIINTQINIRQAVPINQQGNNSNNSNNNLNNNSNLVLANNNDVANNSNNNFENSNNNYMNNNNTGNNTNVNRIVINNISNNTDRNHQKKVSISLNNNSGNIQQKIKDQKKLSNASKQKQQLLNLNNNNNNNKIYEPFKIYNPQQASKNIIRLTTNIGPIRIQSPRQQYQLKSFEQTTKPMESVNTPKASNIQVSQNRSSILNSNIPQNKFYQNSTLNIKTVASAKSFNLQQSQPQPYFSSRKGSNNNIKVETNQNEKQQMVKKPSIIKLPPPYVRYQSTKPIQPAQQNNKNNILKNQNLESQYKFNDVLTNINIIKQLYQEQKTKHIESKNQNLQNVEDRKRQANTNTSMRQRVIDNFNKNQSDNKQSSIRKYQNLLHPSVQKINPQNPPYRADRAVSSLATSGLLPDSIKQINLPPKPQSFNPRPQIYSQNTYNEVCNNITSILDSLKSTLKKNQSLQVINNQQLKKTEGQQMWQKHKLKTSYDPMMFKRQKQVTTNRPNHEIYKSRESNMQNNRHEENQNIQSFINHKNVAPFANQVPSQNIESNMRTKPHLNNILPQNINYQNTHNNNNSNLVKFKPVHAPANPSIMISNNEKYVLQDKNSTNFSSSVQNSKSIQEKQIKTNSQRVKELMRNINKIQPIHMIPNNYNQPHLRMQQKPFYIPERPKYQNNPINHNVYYTNTNQNSVIMANQNIPKNQHVTTRQNVQQKKFQTHTFLHNNTQRTPSYTSYVANGAINNWIKK